MGNILDPTHNIRTQNQGRLPKITDPHFKSKSMDPSMLDNLERQVSEEFKDSDDSPGPKYPQLANHYSQSHEDSSEDDGEKFKAAAEANKIVRLSEKKIYAKLATEAKKPRKGTIDVEHYMTNKTQSLNDNTPQNAIKRDYYAKLGIDRNKSLNMSVRIPVKLGKSKFQEKGDYLKSKFQSSLGKSLSSKTILNDGLELELKKSKTPHSDDEKSFNGVEEEEEQKNVVEEKPLSELPKEHQMLEQREATFNPLKRSNTIEGPASLISSQRTEVVETTYTTKDSGNWRLEMIKAAPIARTGDRIRSDLLSKLTYQKIWLTPFEKPSTHQTVFIYDWDDTLLCTSFLNPTGFYDENLEIPELAKKHLEKLEKAVEKVLKESIKYGKTYIVTNAAEGWVQFSSKKYMPKVYEALQKVEVISARSKFEKQYPGDSYEWKMQAFTEIQKELESSMITNIIA